MSDYKTILVHYDAGKGAPVRLETAIGLAGTFGAHVACLYALSAITEPAYGYQATEIMREALQRRSADMLAVARRSYADCKRRTGFEKIEWRESKADALDAVALHARYADLVVI